MRRASFFIRAGLWSIHQLRDGHLYNVLKTTTTDQQRRLSSKRRFKSDFQYQYFLFSRSCHIMICNGSFHNFLVTVFGKVLSLKQFSYQKQWLCTRLSCFGLPK
jgi:hypothetical protein